jgi:hypothetical protein
MMGQHSTSQAFTPDRARLLQQLLRAKGVQVAAAQAPTRRPHGGPAPLSFSQERLWFFDQLAPGSPAYNLPAALRLVGALDDVALARSLDEIERRHEVLRTTFTVLDGEPVQRVAPPASSPLPLVDLAGLPAAMRAPVLERLAKQAARGPFDLEHGPVLRRALVALDATDHALLVTMHHIVADAWSIAVFVRFAAGEPSPLTELPIQYADFAWWQRQWLTGEPLATELAYWRERLAGAPPVLELPTDRPRPAVRTVRGSYCQAKIPAELVQQLARLARDHGTTLFVVLLAAFQVVLARSSGQTDIVVGTPVAGRRQVETEPLIGLFINTLVLRTDLAGAPPFAALVARTREVALGALAHADLPFEKLVEELQPARALSYSPLFQVMFRTLRRPGSSCRDSSSPL